jgi:hypothetical protein
LRTLVCLHGLQPRFQAPTTATTATNC